MDHSDSTLGDSGQSAMNYSQEIVKAFPDSQLPVVTFLLHNPSKEMDSDVTTGILPELLEVFQKAVKEKSMDILRTYLEQYILTVWRNFQNEIETEHTFSFTSYFFREDDKLDKHDEAILRLHEVMLLFSHEIPQKLKNALMKICKEKKILIHTEDGRVKQFFVYAENKTLRKVCDALSEETVCQMYDNLDKRIANDFRHKPSANNLLYLKVNPSDLKNIQGLKDTSFYCFVLALLKEGLHNRIHTHHLCHYLKHEGETDAPPHLKLELQRYPLTSNPPGLCIIFNMEKDRKGAKQDFKTVKTLFQDTFKYDTIEIINPKKKDVNSTIENLQADRNKFYDSLVVVFMSHGNETSLIVDDGELHRRVDLIDPIIKINWLAKKPKLFFIQACAIRHDPMTAQKDLEVAGYARGDVSTSFGYSETPLSACLNNLYKKYIDLEGLHPFADTLISHATKWYDAAARHEVTGSPYINILVDVLRQFGRTEPIEEVLRRVHYEINMLKITMEDQVEPHRQAPYFESSLQKVFIFPRQ